MCGCGPDLQRLCLSASASAMFLPGTQAGVAQACCTRRFNHFRLEVYMGRLKREPGPCGMASSGDVGWELAHP